MESSGERESLLFISLLWKIAKNFLYITFRCFVLEHYGKAGTLIGKKEMCFFIILLLDYL